MGWIGCESHRENLISFIFLESPHQVDMKKVIKSSKHFFGYFNTLETHSVVLICIYLNRIGSMYNILASCFFGFYFQISADIPDIIHTTEKDIRIYLVSFNFHCKFWVWFCFFIKKMPDNIWEKIELGTLKDRLMLLTFS